MERRRDRGEGIYPSSGENQLGTAIVERTSNRTTQAATGTREHDLRTRDRHRAVRHLHILSDMPCRVETRFGPASWRFAA